MLRPALPNVPRAGIENAPVLNQRSALGSERLGSPETFGRSLNPTPRFDRPDRLLSISGKSATVKGRPDCTVRTLWTSQLASADESHPRLERKRPPLPNGRSYEALIENRDRTSKADRPRSAAG